jgi:hypothetical protein
MEKISDKYSLNIASINSGYAISGIDLGSGNMRVLAQPKPLLLTGPGTSAYETGEVWHLLDQHLRMQLTQAKLTDFSKLKLGSYTHLILAHGRYDSLGEDEIESIKNWINDGGVLIAIKSAAKWIADSKLIEINFLSKDDEETEMKSRAYSKIDDDRALKMIGGSIFSTKIDLSHPLAFGYKRDFLPVLKNHTYFMQPSKNPYATLVRYNKEPLLSGYVSNENLEKISDSAMMVAERKGKGSVILILDNPLFRGFWYGSSRLFINSLFFGRSFRNPVR